MRARGTIGESWWARRFIDPVEATGDPGRMSRGRSYARGGAVGQVTVDSHAGTVAARVRGSRSRPYEVSVEFEVIGDHTWDRVLADLAGDRDAAAALLAGQMPEHVEKVFARHGARMFPDSLEDLETFCSCPDWGYPCKHTAAVLYTLADLFDETPFALLAWLGRTEEEVVEALGATEEGPSGELDVEIAPLAGRTADFWTRTEPVRMAAPRPFDPLAHWAGGVPGVASRLTPMYRKLGRR